MMLSTLQMLGVYKTRVIYEPSQWPRSPRVARSSLVRAPNRYLGGHGMGLIPVGDRFFLRPTLVTNKHFIFILSFIKIVNGCQIWGPEI